MQRQTNTIWAMKIKKTENADLNGLFAIQPPNTGILTISAGDMDIPLAFPNPIQAAVYLEDAYGVPAKETIACVRPLMTACDADSLECVAIPEPMAIKCPACGGITANKIEKDGVLVCQKCGKPLTAPCVNNRKDG